METVTAIGRTAIAAQSLSEQAIAFRPIRERACFLESKWTDAMPVWAMWARLPLQLGFIATAYWFTRPDPEPSQG